MPSPQEKMRLSALDIEYRTLIARYGGLDVVFQEMNVLGKDGWEVYHVSEPNANQDHYLIWMRRKVLHVEPVK